MSSTKKLTISAMVVALYIVVLYLTQSVSFGAYQIRIATSLYALAYAFPFLMVPMGVANLISNLLFGGLGPLDMFGGFTVGVITTGLIVLIRKYEMNTWWIVLPIIFVPALCVPLWLSYLLDLPYAMLATNLVVGQTIPAILGATLIRVLSRRAAMAAVMGIR